MDFFVMTCVIEAGQYSGIEKYNRQTNEMMPGGEKLLLNRNVVVGKVIQYRVVASRASRSKV